MSEQAIRLKDVGADVDLPRGLKTDRICYWKSPGTWWIYLPRAGIGRLANHQITEHEDRTITVTPSILMTRRRGTGEEESRHGFLNRGEWTEV
jgi:hypothetical protein